MNTYNFLKVSLPLTALFIPAIVFAAPQTFSELIHLIFIPIINQAVVVVISLAVLGFFWGLTKYMFSAEDSSKTEEGRKIMVYGMIGLFVAVSLWGIIAILQRTFL